MEVSWLGDKGVEHRRDKGQLGLRDHWVEQSDIHILWWAITHLLTTGHNRDENNIKHEFRKTKTID